MEKMLKCVGLFMVVLVLVMGVGGDADAKKKMFKMINELVKIIGEQGITFYFQVIMDGGYEDYSISIYPDFNNEFPKVESDTEYSEDNEEDGGEW